MTGVRRPLARVALAGLVALFVPACGSAPPPAAPKRAQEPVWQDVFDVTPDVYAVVHPQAIKRDPVYGSLWKAVLRIAQAKSEMVGVRALDAAEGCDEIVVGLSRGEAVIVLRGVPANLDAQRMQDASGQPLFRVVNERANVQELAPAGGPTGASMFVLPDRTWVAAIGEAQARARQAFATPFGRPEPKIDRGALASVRLDGEAFLRPRLANRPALGAIMKKADALTISLLPGKEGLVARLDYEDDDASAWGEAKIRAIVAELGRAEPDGPGGRLAWLKEARVSREGRAVVLRTSVPQRLLEELPKARSEQIEW